MDERPADPLRDALQQSMTGESFEAKKFFKVWFRKHGQPHFFLFTKNLKVTNMQVAELHALLRTHIVWRDTQRHVRDFQLVDVHEFYASVQSLYDSFSPTNQEQQDPAQNQAIIRELYADLIRDVVCIQLFFGSCAVFLPPAMTLDPLPVCAESGYVHSCGPSIWNRNIAKATKTGISERLREHLDTISLTRPWLRSSRLNFLRPVEEKSVPACPKPDKPNELVCPINKLRCGPDRVTFDLG